MLLDPDAPHTSHRSTARFLLERRQLYPIVGIPLSEVSSVEMVGMMDIVEENADGELYTVVGNHEQYSMWRLNSEHRRNGRGRVIPARRRFA
jgi:hypothetical protein